jgi:hypothetical protein
VVEMSDAEASPTMSAVRRSTWFMHWSELSL